MLSEKLKLQNKPGVQRLQQIGEFLVIADKQLYEQGKPSRFVVANERNECVDSVRGSQGAAEDYAHKRWLCSSLM